MSNKDKQLRLDILRGARDNIEWEANHALAMVRHSVCNMKELEEKLTNEKDCSFIYEEIWKDKIRKYDELENMIKEIEEEV